MRMAACYRGVRAEGNVESRRQRRPCTISMRQRSHTSGSFRSSHVAGVRWKVPQEATVLIPGFGGRSY